MIISKLMQEDAAALVDYAAQMSPEARLQFAPHSFTLQGIWQCYQSYPRHTGWIAREPGHSNIAGYFIVKHGIPLHDLLRYQQYGIQPHLHTDFLLAPSVAGLWQGKGLAQQLLDACRSFCQQNQAKRLLLWGGVQNNNERAIAFYRKNGFEPIGQFEHQGQNTDMMLVL